MFERADLATNPTARAAGASAKTDDRSCGHRLETILVVEATEDWLRDDSMAITYLMAAG